MPYIVPYAARYPVLPSDKYLHALPYHQSHPYLSFVLLLPKLNACNNNSHDAGRIKLVYHLDGAVALAKQLCRPGCCCVMSPAAASYGIFKNFEARGEAFVKLVLEAA